MKTCVLSILFGFAVCGTACSDNSEGTTATTESDGDIAPQNDANSMPGDDGDALLPTDDLASQTEDASTGTVYEVTTADGEMKYTPENLTIKVGDTVRFSMSAAHNAIEVSKETYDARGRTPVAGGFLIYFSETKEITFEDVGMHYYVCTPHVTADMVGTITVERAD